MVFQFPFFNETVFTGPMQFESRMKAFFDKLPRIADYRFAVEIRNKYWLKPRLLNVLRENNVALVLQDQAWMPSAEELFEKYDPITADFAYIRWLGDRKGIEQLTRVWNSTLIVSPQPNCNRGSMSAKRSKSAESHNMSTQTITTRGLRRRQWNYSGHCVRRVGSRPP